MILVVAALAAPLVGMTADDGRTFHRVDLEGLPMAEWETAPGATAVCGAFVKLLARGEEPVEWKWLRTRGTPYTRCRICALPKSKRDAA